MNIPATPAHAAPAATAGAVTTSSPRVPAPADAPATDGLTQQMMPPRFPWLSWHSREVAMAEAVSRTPFRDAPVIGDQIDTTA